jgi:hypothetical protein
MRDQFTDRVVAIAHSYGIAAAQWIFNGNTTDEAYRHVLAGIESGDPEVLDAYRTPDLSGEYAGDYTEDDLASDLELDPGSPDLHGRPRRRA